MTFQQARSKMAKIANGRVYYVGYDELHHRTGKIVVKCSLYLDPTPVSAYREHEMMESILITRPSWKAAFEAMEREIGDQP